MNDLRDIVKREVKNWEGYINANYPDPMKAGENVFRCFAFLGYWYDMEILTGV